MNNDLFFMNSVVYVFGVLSTILLMGEMSEVETLFTSKPLHKERNCAAWLNLLTNDVIDRLEDRNLNSMLPGDMHDRFGCRQPFRRLTNLMKSIGNVLA